MKAQQYSRRRVALAVAGAAVLVTVTLACAGNGLAGAMVPVPTRKPDSAPAPAITDISLRAPVPLPAIKPQRDEPVLTTTEEERSMSAMAASLGLIGPSSFADLPASAPVPGRKPARPGAALVPSVETPALAPDSGSPLGDQDAALYRKIFAAQADAEWQEADNLLAKASDRRLRGHVLYQRFMHPSYKARFAELAEWMQLYGDHPGAEKIHRLALSRKPAAYDGKIAAPRNRTGKDGYVLPVLSSTGDSYTSGRRLNTTQRREVDRLTRQIRADIGRGAPTKALKRLSNDSAARLMDTVEYDQMRAQIASAYLVLGKTEEARTLAAASARRSGGKAPMAGWAGGLAAWRQKDYKAAAGLFEQTAASPYSTSWMQSAGAYWASRAHMRSGDMKQVSIWLKEAAKHPRSFYGMIATRALGWDFDFNWSAPDFTRAHAARLEKIPAAKRAMALVEAGQNHLAEEELLQIDVSKDQDLRLAVLAYTHQAHLPGLAMRMASAMARPDGSLYDAALYPLLPWTPDQGYNVDRALIHAVIRQESKFSTTAESPSGAIGLMQIMPSTAGYMTGSLRFADRAGRHHLKHPQTNLTIGQKYIGHLLEHDGIESELMSLAIAYNAGPGNLRKWKKELSDIDDPLLFIEMIPMAETRNYVERVLANYWVYRMRLDQPLPSLEAVAEGKWADYVPMDDRSAKIRLAANFKSFRLADGAARN